MKRLTVICVALLVVAGTATADLSYTSKAAWDFAVGGGTTQTINWDDLVVADGTASAIAGNRYAGLLASPTLSADAGSGLFIVNPSPAFFGADFFPTSNPNVFSPDVAPYPISPEGTLTITFADPIYAIGAWFLDVEADFATTGIRVGGYSIPSPPIREITPGPGWASSPRLRLRRSTSSWPLCPADGMERESTTWCTRSRFPPPFCWVFSAWEPRG